MRGKATGAEMICVSGPLLDNRKWLLYAQRI
jgi:hypothetical protein